MKKLVVICLLYSLHTDAQKAKFNENSVTYAGKTYKVGNIIHLGYGSGTNKEFVFVSYGKSVGGFNLPGLYKHANVDWSKADVSIIELYTKNGVVWAKCTPKDHGTSIGSVIGNKIYINIEGAADNKEITGVDNQPNNTTTSNNNKTEPVPAQKESATAPSPGQKESAAAPTPQNTPASKSKQPVKKSVKKS